MYEITRQRRFNKSGLIFVGLVMLLMVGAFYGCQFLQPKTNPAELSDQMPLYRRIGILKSLGGVRTSNSGTHLLQLDDGNTILLKSLQINLDDPTYLGKTVELRGILTYTTDNKQIMEVANIDLVQQEAATTGVQASWKDYRNVDIGLTIKYKDDLKLDDKSGFIVFSKESAPVKLAGQTQATDITNQPVDTASKDDAVVGSSSGVTAVVSPAVIVHKMTIGRELLAENETMYTKAGIANGDAEMLSSGVSRSRIGSGSYDALKKADGNTTTYYISAGKSIYTVKLETGNDETTLQDQNLFYEMLGTMSLDSAVKPAPETDLANNSTQSGTIETQAAKTDEKETVSNISDIKEPVIEPVVAPKEVTAPIEQAKKTVDLPAITAPAPTVPTQVAPITSQSTEESTSEVLSETETANLEGYEKLESESFKFSMQYPKSWFYSGSAGTDQSVIRHYEFGSKPLEEVPGAVSLDLMSGAIPAGSSTTVNGRDVTVVNTASGVEVYSKGSGSRIYRFSGPSTDKATLMNMASSVSD